MRHVRVSLVLDVAVGSDASLFRGNASESAENGAPARAARNVRRRAHESGASPARITKRVAESARERRCDNLRADGGAAGFVIGQVIMRVVAVQSHVLLRLGVASERVESEAFPTPSSRTMEPVGRRGVLGCCQRALGP